MSTREEHLKTRRWRTRGAGSSKLAIGSYTMTVRGAARFELRDIYHEVIALSWPRFLLLVVGVHMSVNLAFAGLYLVQAGAIANLRPGSFADAFFFSVETSSTTGYGDMYPVSTYGHSIATVEIFAGIALTALTTGLLFVRFSRPMARIRYATQAVIAQHDGHPTLMVRIANGRRALLHDATAYLSLLISQTNDQGAFLRRVHELRLTRSRLPMFPLTWTLMHRIDEASPLNGYDPAKLLAHDARLVVGVEARDATLAAQVVDTKDYGPADIVCGMRYAEVMSLDSEGHPVADISAISRLESDVGPEPVISGWEDRYWDDGER